MFSILFNNVNFTENLFFQFPPTGRVAFLVAIPTRWLWGEVIPSLQENKNSSSPSFKFQSHSHFYPKVLPEREAPQW